MLQAIEEALRNAMDQDVLERSVRLNALKASSGFDQPRNFMRHALSRTAVR